MMTAIRYGASPKEISEFTPVWDEYMHYLYLPVMIPDRYLRVPQNLGFLTTLISGIIVRENFEGYVYVTARRGYAVPGNPLNRPGWHADGFGTDDINYIWSDRWPTRFAVGDFGEISEDHIVSGVQFDALANGDAVPKREIDVYEGKPKMIYRLDPTVIHSTPEIPAPGGERSFFKISLSQSKYNLRGNSHNYLFDYNWKMWDREEVRNDPAYAGGDAGPE